MTNATALALIGHVLEAVKVQVFEFETVGPHYFVKSKFLTKINEWVLRHTFNLEVTALDESDTTIRSVSFSTSDLSRLDDHAKKQNGPADRQDYASLSGLLRTLGDHLDRIHAKKFRISWTHDSVIVDYHLADGQSDSRTFTLAKLERIGSLSRFGTSSRVRFRPKSP
jgi:hypothetical protein